MLVEGKATISGGGKEFGELGQRMSVFEKTPPHCVYVPAGSDWSAVGRPTACWLLCTAPAMPGREAQQIGPEGISLVERGKGANTGISIRSPWKTGMSPTACW